MASRSASLSRCWSRGWPAAAGHDAGDGDVPDPVVAGAVRPGDAGPVEHDGHAESVQPDGHPELVEGAVEEGRVDSENRVQARAGQARGAGHGVRLGDPDVEDPIRVRGGEPAQADRVQHGCGEGDHLWVVLTDLDHLLGERVGPGGVPRRADRLAGGGVDAADGVEVVLLVEFGGPEAAPLLGDCMDDDRPTEALGLPQQVDQDTCVVAVDRPQVLQPQVAEQHLGGEHVLDAALHAVQQVVGLPPEGAAPDRGLEDLEGLLVARVGTDQREVPGQPTHGWRV